MRIKLISDILDFKELEKDWDRLFRNKNNYSNFQSFEFNYYSWKYSLSKSDNILSIVVLFESQNIQSILPFYIDKRLRLRFINDIHADFCDCLTNMDIDFDIVVKELQSNFKIKYFDLINIKNDSSILQKIIPSYYKPVSSSEYSILRLEKGVFPENYSKYKSKQKTEFRRIIKKYKEKTHEVIDCNISEFPFSEIKNLRRSMIQSGLRKNSYLPDGQLFLIEKLYNKGKIILSIVKTDNKINAISFVIKDAIEYLIWIDLFDKSKMINIFNYISLLSVLSYEKSIKINFGRGMYGYKLYNFLPFSKKLFSLRIFSSKRYELYYNLERHVFSFLRGCYKIFNK